MATNAIVVTQNPTTDVALIQATGPQGIQGPPGPVVSITINGSSSVTVSNTTGATLNDSNAFGSFTASLPASGVTAGTYGSSTAIPIVTVNSTGVVTGVSTETIASVAVSSLTGTANQVLVNGTSGTTETGALTLTLPQSIGTSSSPSFASLALTATTASTSTATGALIVDGGAGIAGAVYGGSLFDSGNRVVTALSAGGGISVTGSAPAGLTVTNTGVTSNVAGTGISVSGATGAVTITNSGVTSLAGTTNQVTVSASTGSVTLSLPQNINSGASPTFSGANFTSIPNAALTNSSVTVTAGTGLSGGGSVSLGGSVTLSNAGVTSLAGTTNQISVSGSTGSVTLSLPQNINSGAAPTFAGTNFTSIPNGALTNSAVTVTAGTDMSGGGSVSLGSSITLNNTATLATVTGRGASTSTALSLTNSTASTSTSTGALVVTGGVGVGGALYAGSVYDNGNRVLTNLTAGTAISVSGAGPTGVTVNNTGVTSNVAGTGISVSGATGAVTITNTGVTSIAGTSNQITASASTGGVTLSLPSTVAIATLTLTNALGAIYGGTGQSAYTTGDILYASATNTLSRLGAGTNGYVLTMVSGAPAWAAATGGGGSVSSVGVSSSGTYSAALTIGSSPVTSSGTITITPNLFTSGAAGIVPASGGGTTLFIRADGTWAVPVGTGVFDAKVYGVTANGTTDDTSALQSAINACNSAGGGMVLLPAGTIKISSALQFYSGTTPSIVAYSNITLKGQGSSGVNGTIISQVTTGANIIQGLNDVANGAEALNNHIVDVCLSFGGATLTNSGHGIYLAQQSAGGPSFENWRFDNVEVTNCQGSGKYGFYFESLIVSTLINCDATTCANGFILDGTNPGTGNFNSVSTSVTFINCYANMGANANNGFVTNDSTYISYVGCACDYTANSTGAAYTVQGSSGVSYNGCAFELDGTHTLSSGWLIQGDSGSNGSSGVTLTSCYGFLSKSTTEINVQGTSTVTLIGYSSNSSVSGSTGLKTDGSGNIVHDINCNVASVATPYNIASGDTYVNGVPTAPTVQTANYTVLPRDSTIICNKSSSLTLTLPTASSYTGRWLYVKTIQAQTVVSATSNVRPSTSQTAGTAILAATAGKWAALQSDGTDWVVMMNN